jgi:membrane fusion protein (multidrug efflux system)
MIQTIKRFTKTSTVFAVVIASLLLTQCHSSKEEAEEKKEEAPNVEVFALQKGTIHSSIKIPGELISYRDVDLYAKVSSFAKQLYADVGSEVTEGQLLALMEAPEITSQLVAAESRLQSQEALYKASKANYDRLAATSKTPGTISQNDLDQAQAKMNSDFAQLEAAKATQKEISSMRSYLEIRAPFNGIISARNVSLGAYVGPSGKGSEFPMFTLNEQKRLRLVVYVPEAYSSYLHANDEIQFSVKAFPNEKFKAQVKRLAGAMDKKLRAQRIEMDVYNDNKKLLPGMIAEVKISFSSGMDGWVVPKTAIVNSPEKIFMIRIRDRKVEWVEISKGLEANQQVEVFGPLQEGDQLVTRANEEIRDGNEVGGVIFKKEN